MKFFWAHGESEFVIVVEHDVRQSYRRAVVPNAVKFAQKLAQRPTGSFCGYWDGDWVGNVPSGFGVGSDRCLSRVIVYSK